MSATLRSGMLITNFRVASAASASAAAARIITNWITRTAFPLSFMPTEKAPRPPSCKLLIKREIYVRDGVCSFTQRVAGATGRAFSEVALRRRTACRRSQIESPRIRTTQADGELDSPERNRLDSRESIRAEACARACARSTIAAKPTERHRELAAGSLAAVRADRQCNPTIRSRW